MTELSSPCLRRARRACWLRVRPSRAEFPKQEIDNLFDAWVTQEGGTKGGVLHYEGLKKILTRPAPAAHTIRQAAGVGKAAGAFSKLRKS